MNIQGNNGVCEPIKKGDIVFLSVVEDLKGKLCFQHVMCSDDPTLPGEMGERESVRIFSPHRNGMYDFSFGDVWKAKILKVHRTDIFTRADHRAIYIRVEPLEKISLLTKTLNQIDEYFNK